MSRRTVTRLALAGLLTAAFAAPINAGDTEVAPMPRPVAKTFGFPPLFQIELEFQDVEAPATPRKEGGIHFEFRFSSDDSKPQTRTARPVMPPCCAFDCAQMLAVAPMPRQVALSHVPCCEPLSGHLELLKLSAEVFGTEDSLPSSHFVPAMPPSPAILRCEGVLVQPAATFPCPTATMTRTVTVQAPDMRVMYPLVGVTAVRRDESGTWWAEVHGVPQPKHASATWFVAPPASVAAAPQLMQEFTCRPVKPTNVPAGEFDVMAGVFEQMLGAKQAAPVPCPVQVAGMSVRSSLPVAAPTVPPCAVPTPARQGMTGTWTREIGPIMYVVKMAPDHVTITATKSAELADGKTYTEGIVMTADYHLTRDGTTVVGLITSVDAVIEGTLPQDMELPGEGDDLSLIQKVLVDKPFAFNVRHYGEVMVIGNVRLPELEGARGVCYPLTVLGGRYTQLGAKPLPKPRAIKLAPLRDLVPERLAATPSSYSYPPAVQPASGTLPPLPQNVPNHLPMNPPRSLPRGFGTDVPPAIDRVVGPPIVYGPQSPR